MSIVLINAGPGSGKSFTLKYGYRLFSGNLIGRLEPTEEQAVIFDYFKEEFNAKDKVCFFAHNNTTKDDLVRHLPPKTPVYTFHGAGMAAIIRRYRYQKLDNYRSEKLISDITGKFLRDMSPSEKFNWLGIKRLVHYFKLENFEPTPENYSYCRTKYPALSVFNFPDDWQKRCQQLMERAAIPNGSVEFVDMLWMGSQCVVSPLYDVGFVDESQDISNCAYNLVTRLCRNVVFCGDKNQCINAFAGASEEMYDKIESVSDAVLPLKMSLRNPPFICDMANHIRPGGIIQGPNKGPGSQATIDYESLPGELAALSPKDCLLISRTNAALISCAIKLHKLGVPCQIVDKDLADEVKYFFKGFNTTSLPKLHDRIDAYQNKYKHSKNEMWKQMVADKASYARELLDASKNWSDLMELIEVTFSAKPHSYKLSSIHKAKGLEAPNIFILNPPIELPIAMQHPIGKEQETNLAFVAVTRCAMNLFWVTSE